MIRLLSIVMAWAMVAGGAAAQTGDAAWPERPIRLIVPFPAGSSTDIISRIIAQRLGSRLGQQVVVENRAGASGAIGTQAVAGAAPDGHMLLLGQTAEIAINQHWVKGIGYDPERDLAPVALATVVPLALTVPKAAPHTSVAEMLRAIPASGPGLSYASAGVGTPGHFAAEFLRLKTRSNMTHVPYKGAGPALNDLVAGHVDLYFPGFPAAMPHVKAGTLKILAVSSAARATVAPDVPTVTEAAGIPGFDFTLWQGFFAPRGTPNEVVARLNREINAVLADPDIRQKLVEAGANVTPLTVDQFAAFVRAESAKYAGIIKDAGLKPE
jgi:tripartite-type tricarboxylate transporter receptor subunit TctC